MIGELTELEQWYSKHHPVVKASVPKPGRIAASWCFVWLAGAILFSTAALALVGLSVVVGAIAEKLS